MTEYFPPSGPDQPGSARPLKSRPVFFWGASLRRLVVGGCYLIARDPSVPAPPSISMVSRPALPIVSLPPRHPRLRNWLENLLAFGDDPYAVLNLPEDNRKRLPDDRRWPPHFFQFCFEAMHQPQARRRALSLWPLGLDHRLGK